MPGKEIGILLLGGAAQIHKVGEGHTTMWENFGGIVVWGDNNHTSLYALTKIS